MLYSIEKNNDLFLPLIHAATPKLYENNLFWALKVPCSASERDIKKQLQLIKAQKSLNKASKTQFDIVDDSIRDIEMRYRNPETRFLDEFFSYWTKEIDPEFDFSADTSVEQEEIISDTLEILNLIEQKAEQDTLILHDAAVFAHYHAIKFEEMSAQIGHFEDHLHFLWSKAIYLWKKSVHEETIWTYLRQHIRNQSDPRLTTGLIRRFRHSLLPAIYSVNFHLFARYIHQNQDVQARYHKDLLDRQNAEAKDLDVAFHIAGEVWINQIIHECNQLITNNANIVNWEKSLENLKTNIHEPLQIIHEWFDEGSSIRDDISNRIAETIFKFTVKHSTADKNYQSALSWMEYALEIVSSDSLKRKIESNIHQTEQLIHSESCWFCKDYLSSEHSNLIVHTGSILKEYFFYTNNESITIPRCPRCKNNHIQHRKKCLLGSFAGAFAGSAAVLSTMAFTPIWLIWGAGAGLFVGYETIHKYNQIRIAQETKPLSYYKVHAAYQQVTDNHKYNHSSQNEFPRKV